MAGGKTTFGEALAARTGWSFIDLDREIEHAEGRSIADIMASDGEEYFRRVESRILKQTSAMKHVVVSCGGGTPCYRDNMEFMTLHGMTLWRIASPERIAERIRVAGDTRPLLSGKTDTEVEAFIVSHLKERQPYYCRALWRLSGEHLENQKEISDTVDAFLASFPLFNAK